MDNELAYELINLEQSVRRQFASPEFGSKPGDHTILMFAVFPAFDNYQHLSINRIKNQQNQTGTLTVWNRVRDRAAFVSPVERLKYPRPIQPTIESKTIDATHDELSKVTSQFTGVQIPIANVGYSIGLDGVSYELQIGSGFGWTRLHWWGRIPDERHPIAEGIEMLCGYLESANVE